MIWIVASFLGVSGMLFGLSLRAVQPTKTFWLMWAIVAAGFATGFSLLGLLMEAAK